MFIENAMLDAVVQTLCGIVLGLAANKLNSHVVAPRAVLPAALVKILVPLAVLLGVQALAPRFADEWQTSVAGLFFVWGFFSVQRSMNEALATL